MTDSPDVIHIEGMLLEVPAYPSLIERLAVLLRPGGLLIAVEVEPRYVSPSPPHSRTDRTHYPLVIIHRRDFEGYESMGRVHLRSLPIERQ